MRYLAHLVSVIFHPVFILYYLFLSLYIITPVEFIFSDSKQGVALHLLVAGMSIFFPMVSIIALRASGLIRSFSLEDQKDRIGPLIASIVFYIWLFLNYRQFDIGPAIFESTILGAVIAMSLAFFINNFSKISLHSVGAGGLLGAVSLYRISMSVGSYKIHLGDQVLLFSPNLFLIVVVLIVGIIGTSRLYLKAHRPSDIYGGYIVGFLSQLVAYKLSGVL